MSFLEIVLHTNRSHLRTLKEEELRRIEGEGAGNVAALKNMTYAEQRHGLEVPLDTQVQVYEQASLGQMAVCAIRAIFRRREECEPQPTEPGRPKPADRHHGAKMQKARGAHN